MKKSHFVYLGLILTSIPFYASANDTFLREEIDQMKEDLRIVQRKLYHEKSSTDVPDTSISNFQMRLGEYDELIRNINGKVENIEYRLNTIEKKLENFNTDIELRFEQFKRDNLSVNQEANVSSKLSTPTTSTSKNIIPATGTTPTELYNSAKALLDSNDYVKAEEKFLQFLATYPKDNLAENAQYWLGEVYYKQQNFRKAAIAFKEGFNKYPEGAKAPDCLLKLGLSMKAIEKKEEACIAFVNLPKNFNKASAEILSRAKKEVEALGCK